MEVGSFSVSCCFKNCDDGFCWSFIRVYRPMLKLEREDFWSELGDVRGLWSDPWCMAGDFNMIKFPFKHSRGGRLSSTMRRFLEVIKDLELRDLPLQGVLIPKKGGVEDLKDFRPISLVGGLYKWLTKVLANRLKGVLAKVISMTQNAFVEGRQIMDAVLIVNEAIDLILKSNRETVLCKLDIEKAYDHVEWFFFCQFWRRWGSGKSGVARLNGVYPQLVNLDKSELIPIGRVENVEELVEELGCKVGRLLSTYLGMPLGALFKSAAASDRIEETLQEIGYLPRAIRMRLEQIQRDFLWRGGALEALLGKWSWRFANERKTLWNQVIRGKYGEERGGWSTCEARKAYGVGLWKAIRKLGHLVTHRFDFVVGDGRKMSFWKDKWCRTTPLCESFPSLFALTTSKEAWVNEVWTTFGKRGGSWSPCFSRPFNDWEMKEVERLFCCLGGKKVNVDEEDRVKWLDSKDDLFLPKLSFFAWEASWGKVLTLDRIQKRDKGSVDVTLFIIWSVLGVSLFSKGNPLRAEGVLWG
ncbi:Transposon TX1 uncharacterized 149 kDa protein [Vitis vinifera]|uniref:Transposon TX1 uncharacterized 149 kDa protein n=1 Tax=Vitis vinifera TaxID=29760 RepID=A0A438C2D8_VITVI|nr:Transposon TX1 uncharacterized 149 kDa protein [Vitis vinifera]